MVLVGWLARAREVKEASFWRARVEASRPRGKWVIGRTLSSVKGGRGGREGFCAVWGCKEEGMAEGEEDEGDEEDEAGPGKEEEKDSDDAGSNSEGKEDNEREDWDGERVQADVSIPPPSFLSSFTFPFVVSPAPQP